MLPALFVKAYHSLIMAALTAYPSLWPDTTPLAAATQ